MEVQTYRELIEQHDGKEGHEISKDGRWILFADGARITNDGDRQWVMVEPPDEIDQLKGKRDFLQARIDRLEVEFLRLREEFYNQAEMAVRYSNQYGAHEDAPRELAALAKRIQDLRERRDLIIFELEMTPEADARREREFEHMERAAEQQKLMAKIAAINI